MDGSFGDVRLIKVEGKKLENKGRGGENGR
jgi:hypothetical protein